MRYNSHNKASKPGLNASSYDPEKKTRGFAGLDPSRLGLGTPEWLEPSAPPSSPPIDTPPRTVVDTPSSQSSLREVEQSPAIEPSTEPRTLVEGLKVVCICKGIKKRVFWKALDDGAQTKEEINRMTGSGSGGCQGRRCGPRILEMLRKPLP